MTAETDTLVKPDMVAVLQRTHVSKDLHGFLLPTLEAVSNAMHGIEARFGDDARKQGKIDILMSGINDPQRLMISVADNGLGPDNDNYKSFKTPFSGHKLQQNGRGFGRFIAFKVFNRILYSSRFEATRRPASAPSASTSIRRTSSFILTVSRTLPTSAFASIMTSLARNGTT